MPTRKTIAWSLSAAGLAMLIVGSLAMAQVALPAAEQPAPSSGVDQPMPKAENVPPVPSPTVPSTGTLTIQAVQPSPPKPGSAAPSHATFNVYSAPGAPPQAIGHGVSGSYGGGGGQMYGAFAGPGRQPMNISAANMTIAFQGPESDPEMLKLVQTDAQMEQEAASLVGQYQQATEPAKRAELKTKLEDLATKHFDIRQQRRELELKRLQAQLERVRDLVKKRADARDVIIKRRVAQQLGEEDELAF